MPGNNKINSSALFALKRKSKKKHYKIFSTGLFSDRTKTVISRDESMYYNIKSLCVKEPGCKECRNCRLEWSCMYEKLIFNAT